MPEPLEITVEPYTVEVDADGCVSITKPPHQWFPEDQDIIATLAAALAEARRDSERLDWLETQMQPVVRPTMPDGEPELLAYAWGVQWPASFVRDAIDSAIAAQQPAREEA